MSETYIYRARSGIMVTSCYPEPEHTKMIPYLIWSYSSWGKKIWAGIKYNMEHGWDFTDDWASNRTRKSA